MNNADLFAGLLLEKPRDDFEHLGPVLSCLIGETFAKLKKGDRLFYRHASAKFTDEQIEAIDNYSMSRVLCDTLNGLDSIQEKAFVKPWEGKLTEAK